MLELSALVHNADLSSLRTGMMAGAPCPVELMQKVIDRMHMRQVTMRLRHDGRPSPISFQSSMDDSPSSTVVSPWDAYCRTGK
jgi:fatty-acyl-CoA synthase